MKKISTLLFVAAALLAAASCGRKETYEFVSFASLANSKYSFSEDAGTVKIPVNVYNTDGEASVTLRLSDDTAVAGTNYNLVSPVNGVLTFEKGETQKEVEIEIINIDGYTGNCKFTLDIVGTSDGLDLGMFRTASITISDNDHPLKAILGKWQVSQTSMNASGATYPATYTMNLIPDPNDLDVVWCDAICYIFVNLGSYGPAYLKGTVSADLSTITFASEQAFVGDPADPSVKAFDLGYGTGLFYGDVYIHGSSGSGYYIPNNPVPVVFNKVDDVTYETAQGYAYADDYVWPSNGGFVVGEKDGAYKTVWTKQD